MNRALCVVVVAGFAAACPAVIAQDSAKPAAAQAAASPLFEGMGSHTRPITTSSPLAQKYFDQGLVWMFAFNHDEAIRSFKEAARLDPEAAMPWWGIALCNGPHINNPVMDEEHSKAAWEALQKASAPGMKASQTERALIGALAARYANPAAGELPLSPEDRAPLDHAYAAAMRTVHLSNTDDTDISTMYAESLMDLLPWNLWARDGSPRAETTEIVAVLEDVLGDDPNHPGANHLYIHAVEASPKPERANAAAERLRTLVPASGHLIHMPAHIDVRTGRWQKASDQNEAAMRVDAKYREISPNQGFYRLYMAHNPHFLAYACMMEGREKDAVAAARVMLDGIPPEALKAQGALFDAYTSIGLETLMRFGRWDDILKEPAPAKELPITTAMWRFTRAIALGAKGELDAAVREQAEFKKAADAVPEGAMMAINPAEDVLAIAAHMLEGELAFRHGSIDKAVSELTAAIQIEDRLKYMEPPDWPQPVRHTLGAVLMSAKRFADAEKVYRADLAVWPENGWSLFGLAQCLEARGSKDADAVMARFKKAWSRADTTIDSTCLCIPGGG